MAEPALVALRAVLEGPAFRWRVGATRPVDLASRHVALAAAALALAYAVGWMGAQAQALYRLEELAVLATPVFFLYGLAESRRLRRFLAGPLPNDLAVTPEDPSHIVGGLYAGSLPPWLLVLGILAVALPQWKSAVVPVRWEAAIAFPLLILLTFDFQARVTFALLLWRSDFVSSLCWVMAASFVAGCGLSGLALLASLMGSTWVHTFAMLLTLGVWGFAAVTLWEPYVGLLGRLFAARRDEELEGRSSAAPAGPRPRF